MKETTSQRLKNLKDSLLIAIGYNKPKKYVVSKCGKLRVNKDKGVVEPNWDSDSVKESFSRNTQDLLKYLESSKRK